MMRLGTKSKILITLFLVLIAFHGSAHIAFADEGTADDLSFQGLVNIFQGIACFLVNTFSGILVIMILWSAFLMSVSEGAIPTVDGKAGSRATFEKAKKTLTYSVVGAFVIFGMQFMIELISSFLRDAGADATIEGGFTCNGMSYAGPLGVIQNGIGVLANYMAVAAIGMFVLAIIWGAIAYASAGGDPKGTEAARRIIVNGVVGGLLVFGIAFIIGLIFNVGGIVFG